MLDLTGHKTPKKECHTGVLTSQQAWISSKHGNLCTGLGFSPPGRQSCTKSGFAAVCTLWPYIRDVNISITCLLQRLFQGDSKGWLNIPS